MYDLLSRMPSTFSANFVNFRRISISVVSSNVTLTTDLIPMDVFPDMTFNDIKALVEGEINIPPAAQHFFYNQQPVTNTAQSLTDVGVGEGDMLGMAVQDPNQFPPSRQGGSRQPPTRQNPQQQSIAPDAERMRLHIIGDPRVMAGVRRQDPELADAANDSQRFHTVWDERKKRDVQLESEKNAQIALLNADPFNLEAQRKIEEMIQHENVQANVQKALEENPECKISVALLRSVHFVSSRYSEELTFSSVRSSHHALH